MLKKTQRLSKKEFDRFFSTGKRLHSPLFQLIYTPDSAFHGAAVVGKKVYKKAVDRNKLRRRLYNALYALKTESDLSGVFIVIAKPAAKESSYSKLRESLSNLIKTM